MAIIKNPTDLNHPINYVATLAFFCCVSCVVVMLRFGGFKASLDLLLLRKKDEEIAPSTSMTGAYRVNRDEFYGNGKIYEPPKKLTPSMVKLPPNFDPEPSMRPAKSTGDLARPVKLPPQAQLHRSTHDVSQDPRGGPSRPHNDDIHSAPPAPPERKKREAKSQDKEQKKMEKQRLVEAKAREKAAALERAKEEKLRREREKQAAQEQAKMVKMNKKKTASQSQLCSILPKKKQPAPKPVGPMAALPAPPQAPSEPVASAAPAPPAAAPAPQPAAAYSSNTLSSSISKSSGPPPYSETIPAAGAPPVNSNRDNVSFGKPIDSPTDSWDLISQHRQQIKNRQVAAATPRGAQKNMVMDLQYKLGAPDNDNSEA